MSLERRPGGRVDRLLPYRTSEARKEDALMVLPYRPGRVDEAGRHFDAATGHIRAGECPVATPPEATVPPEMRSAGAVPGGGIIGGIGDIGE